MFRKASLMELSSKEEVRPNTIAEVKVDVSFRKIKKNAICFHIWRIEEDRLEAETRDKYGTFLDNGAYIIYVACLPGTFADQDTITREAKSTLFERYIHFWLGKNVNEDKRSNVTHKVQELDSYFGNTATEFREAQNHESPRFMSYFKRGIVIQSSSLSSSLDDHHLYQISGRRYLRITQMPNISWDYFSAEYVMIIKMQTKLFIWLGRSSSKLERRTAMQWAHSKYKLNYADIVVIDDGYEQSLPEQFKAIWNTHLPLNQRVVRQSNETTVKDTTSIRCFKCGYKAGRLYLDQLDVDAPSKDDLKDSTAVYLLDVIPRGIWMWVGQSATQEDKISAMGNGRAYIKKKKYDFTTPVVRVLEGHEPLEFERIFSKFSSDWQDINSLYKPAANLLSQINSMILCQRPKMAADMQLIDDGSGERILYCLTEDYALELPTKDIVRFESDKCYVMEYSVVFPTANPLDIESVGVQSVIYQWIGLEANITSVQKCNKFAKTCFEKFTDKVMYVQMNEFDETPHFLQIFNGKLIIMQSGGNSSDKNKSILKVYGDASYNSKAIELPRNTMLDSRDCYVIKNQYVWVWCGSSSTGDTREIAKGFGDLFGEYTLVLEGKEPNEFANVLNSYSKSYAPPSSSCSNGSNNSSTNGSSYNSSCSNGVRENGIVRCCLPNALKPRLLPPQLFLIWQQRSQIFMQEILNFNQQDLAPEGTFLLDTGISCFVWLGQCAAKYEKEHFMELALFYLGSKPSVVSTAISVIRQAAEPNIFKGLFNKWNNQYWTTFLGYEEKRQEIGINAEPSYLSNGKSSQSSTSSSSPLPATKTPNNLDFDGYQKYPISVLQKERDMLPADVDPLSRELHLTNDDFVSLFGMSFWDFEELPKWKKQEMKKKHKIF